MVDEWEMGERRSNELFKTTRASMKFDRMISSGSSWLMGVKVQRVMDHAHSAIEPGKRISMSKFHQITGHTGEHLLRPTAKYMKIELTAKLAPCEICAQAKIRQANVPKKKMKKLPTRPGYRVFIDISSFKQVSRGGNRHWLIAVDEFSDCSHSFFLSKKSDQIKMIPMWIKGLSRKYGIEIKRIRLYIYDVEFPDGQVKEYAANNIADIMLTQVDSDGMSTTLLEAIVDHRRDEEKALQHHEKYVRTKNGRHHLRKTTKGWELLIKWKDKSESWIRLADMKESHPVEVAEYARARDIDKEPAFKWCAHHTLKKRQVILAALKKRIRKTTHKYGIEIPTSVEHAFELNRKNGNNLWKEALEMEMYNIGVAFEILEDEKTTPAGYTKVSGHLIWSVKMDFTRKA